MTKEITKAFILQEIQDKFKLRELTPEKFVFSEMVIPTYDVGPHLTTWEIKKKTVSITAADAFTFFTVPENEQWLLRSYQVIYLATGAIKGSGLYLWRQLSGDFIYIDLKKGQEVSYLITPPNPVVLQPRATLRYLIDTYVSTQNLTIYIDVLVEVLR